VTEEDIWESLCDGCPMWVTKSYGYYEPEDSYCPHEATAELIYNEEMEVFNCSQRESYV
jgi:hypothetical protein